MGERNNKQQLAAGGKIELKLLVLKEIMSDIYVVRNLMGLRLLIT